MTTLTVHPAVLAIGGEKRVREIAPAHVERLLGQHVDQDMIDRVLVSPDYLAFERRIVAKGWPVPADPLALLGKNGTEGVISGLFVYVATKRLQNKTLPVVFLEPSEVPEWQRLVQVQRPPSPDPDEEEMLLIRALHG